MCFFYTENRFYNMAIHSTSQMTLPFVLYSKCIILNYIINLR